MRRYLKFLVPAGLFAVLVGFFIVGLQKDPSRIPSPLIGKPAPEFSLQSLGDPAWRVGTDDFRGRPYLLNVWATWCGGCREEHDTLLAISRDSGLPMIGLNWKDDRALALDWLGKLGNPYVAVAFDPEGQVAIDWGVYGAPETFLVGADGRVLHKQIGPLTMDIWRRDFLPRLAAAGAGFMIRLAPLLAGLLLATAAVAIDAERAFDDPAMQSRYEHLTRELRCLVCQNQTIADSNATLAQDLRREVRELMRAGRNDDEIRTFLTDRYGDFVLYRPPLTPRTWLLWAAPVLLLLGGIGIAGRVILRRARAARRDPDALDDERGSA